MSQYDFDRNELHLILGRLIHAYARLDHYIGLQLKWLGEYRDRPVWKLLRKTAGFDHRLKILRELSLETWAHSDLKVAGDFEAWFAEVQSVQKARNKFAHGRWGYADKISGEIEFVALSWQTDPEKMKPATRVSLKDFEQLAKQVEDLGGSFMALQEKHMDRVRWKKSWEDSNPDGLQAWKAHQVLLAGQQTSNTLLGSHSGESGVRLPVSLNQCIG